MRRRVRGLFRGRAYYRQTWCEIFGNRRARAYNSIVMDERIRLTAMVKAAG